MAAFLALLILASGRQWLLAATATAGVSLAMLAAAGFLGVLWRRVSRAFDRWKLGVLALELLVLPVGWWAMSIEAAYQAQNPGDHGPFADGSDAMISVTGFVFAFGAAVVILCLIAERIRTVALGFYRRASSSSP